MEIGNKITEKVRHIAYLLTDFIKDLYMTLDGTMEQIISYVQARLQQFYKL